MDRKVIAFGCPPELAAWLETQAKQNDLKLSHWLRRHFTTIRDKRKVRVKK